MGFEEDPAVACVESGMSRAQAIEHLTAPPPPPPAAAARGPNNNNNNNNNNDRSGGGAAAALDELVAMGFARAKAQEALAVTDGDLAAAIDYCMGSSG